MSSKQYITVVSLMSVINMQFTMPFLGEQAGWVEGHDFKN